MNARAADKEIDKALAAMRAVPEGSRQARGMFAAYEPAVVRGMTTVDPEVEGGQMGISFNTANGVQRLKVTAADARNLAESVLDVLALHEARTSSQSPISSEAQALTDRLRRRRLARFPSV